MRTELSLGEWDTIYRRKHLRLLPTLLLKSMVIPNEQRLIFTKKRKYFAHTLKKLSALFASIPSIVNTTFGVGMHFFGSVSDHFI